MTVTTKHALSSLPADECRRLLGTACVGRLAFIHAGQPEVLPVNYVLDGDAVVFATGTGRKLWDASVSPVAFEVDETDCASRQGWSVVIHGLAQEVTEADAPALVLRLRALDIRPWAGGDRPHLVRIAPESITGRRVGSPPVPASAPPPPGSLVELSRDECFELLRTQPVGRLAVTSDDGPPIVLPVNFVLQGEAIVIRSDHGLKLQLLRRQAVSFQADFIDPFHRTGWSVLAHGIGYNASHWETDHLRLEPWASGAKDQWVRIVVDQITGRRLVAADFGWPPSDRGYL